MISSIANRKEKTMIIKTKNHTYRWSPSILMRNIIVMISLMFLLWVGLSYGEVLFKNLDFNPEYSSMNIFTILMNMKGV